MKSNQTPLVRSQREFNNAVSVVSGMLMSEGVQLDRKLLERALSPALSNGKKHGALAAELKAKPKTSGGVIYRSVLTAEANETTLNSFNKLCEMIGSLAEEIPFLTDYKKEMDFYAPRMLESWIKASAYSNESDDFNKLCDALETAFKSKKFDLFHFVKPDRDDSYSFVLELNFSGYSVEFGAEILGEGDIASVSSVYLLKINGKEPAGDLNAHAEKVFSTWVEEFIGDGCIVGISNKFTTTISAELMQAIITESCDQSFQSIVGGDKEAVKEQKLEQLETFTLTFNMNDVAMLQEIQIIDGNHTKESILSGLSSQSLVTTTWFKDLESGFIEDMSGNKVAKILTQEVESADYVEYTDFAAV